MQSQKFSLAGCPRARPNLSNAPEAATAISGLKGMTVPGPRIYKMLEPVRRTCRQVDRAPEARLDQRRGADCAFLAVEQTEKSSGLRLAPDNSNQDRAVEHDHSGNPVSSS